MADSGEVSMADIKLAKLPDRTPIKVAITVTPELHQALSDYAAIYNQTYGQSEPLAELVPHMLAAFLVSDRGFAKARERLGSAAS
jgi:hypothetical protein